MQPPSVLTIAGSDSGGAAGVQADLKTLTALGVYGMSALTAVTAQNSVSVQAVEWLSPKFVRQQIDTVLSDYETEAVKTGFLGKVEMITAVAQSLRETAVPHIIIDPVLVNHQQIAMFPATVTESYASHLLPLASLITPNLTEAALLAQVPRPTTVKEVQTVASHLYQLGAQAVLIKGFVEEDMVLDVLFDGTEIKWFKSERIETNNTHGSGDTLSAAIAAYLALGEDLETAVQNARTFTHVAIKKAARWQLGRGHGPLAHF